MNQNSIYTKFYSPYVYSGTAQEARAQGCYGEYLESLEENELCAQRIAGLVAKWYDGTRVAQRVVRQPIQEYGMMRVECVIAATVHSMTHDKRISPENKAWAEENKDLYIDIPESRMPVLTNMHPGLVNVLANITRREATKELEELTKSLVELAND